MGIKVKCLDGMIEIGGDFQKALGVVKGTNGRKFDPSTKIWTVPAEMREFDSLRTGLPVDVLSGGQGRLQCGRHISAHGNSYSRNEWNALKEGEEKVSEVKNSFSTLFNALEEKYRQELLEISVEEKIIKSILSYGFGDMVEAGKISFSSEDRKEKIMGIWEEYLSNFGKVARAQAEAEEVAREQVYNKYGV